MEAQHLEFELKIAAERQKMEAELAAAQRAQFDAEEKARILKNILAEQRLSSPGQNSGKMHIYSVCSHFVCEALLVLMHGVAMLQTQDSA